MLGFLSLFNAGRVRGNVQTEISHLVSEEVFVRSGTVVVVVGSSSCCAENSGKLKLLEIRDEMLKLQPMPLNFFTVANRTVNYGHRDGSILIETA